MSLASPRTSRSSLMAGVPCCSTTARMLIEVSPHLAYRGQEHDHGSQLEADEDHHQDQQHTDQVFKISADQILHGVSPGLDDAVCRTGPNIDFTAPVPGGSTLF